MRKQEDKKNPPVSGPSINPSGLFNAEVLQLGEDWTAKFAESFLELFLGLRRCQHQA